MALETEDDIFKNAELPLVDEDEDEAMEEEEDEEELDTLERENHPQDEVMDEDNDGEGDEDEEDDDDDDEDDDEDDEEDDEDDDEDDEVKTTKAPLSNGPPNEQDVVMIDDEDDDKPLTVTSPKQNGNGTATNETTTEIEEKPQQEQPALTKVKNDQDQLETYYNTLAVNARLADSYDVVPTVAISYASQIHSVALPKSSKWLFLGGEDGYIRKYDFFGSIDGDVQLTAAQKHSLVDLITNGGSLLGYWENEIPVKRSTIPGETYEPKLSPVYSLAVENRCLWILSGLKSGGINMQSIRHNEGAIVHHFRGHTDTVSVLQLNAAEDKFLSGSWDKNINLWDLNTGDITRKFTESTGQITSLQYRPAGGIDLETVKSQVPGEDDDLDSLFGSDDTAANPKPKETEAQREERADTLKGIDENVFMSSSVDGSVFVWDARTSAPVLKLRPPKGTPPWCVSACWSETGDSIFVGRRNSTVEEFSLKMPYESSGETRAAKTLKFPQVSGPVTVVKTMPNHNHILCGSYDNIRIYDLRLYNEAHKKTPFLIVPGHHGGVLSHVSFDPAYRYMISASGNRGWQGTSTETAFIYEITVN